MRCSDFIAWQGTRTAVGLYAPFYYNDVTMSVIASQITSLTSVYSTVYSDADQRKHQSSASLAFVRGIHRWPVNSPHKGPVTRKMFPFDDFIIWASVKINYWFQQAVTFAMRILILIRPWRPLFNLNISISLYRYIVKSPSLSYFLHWCLYYSICLLVMRFSFSLPLLQGFFSINLTIPRLSPLVLYN